MGVELFGIYFLLVLGAAAFFFFTGSFGIAKKGENSGDSGPRPTHAFVENETEGKTFGADTAESVRARAEDDPDTEVRSPH